MAFEVYPNEGLRITPPRASLSKAGVIGINRSAVSHFDLKKYTKCMLFYDKEEQKIKLEFSNDSQNKKNIMFRHRASGAEITSKNFFSYFKILPSHLILCDLEKGENENILILDLKRGVFKKQRQES